MVQQRMDRNGEVWVTYQIRSTIWGWGPSPNRSLWQAAALQLTCGLPLGRPVTDSLYPFPTCGIAGRCCLVWKARRLVIVNRMLVLLIPGGEDGLRPPWLNVACVHVHVFLVPCVHRGLCVAVVWLWIAVMHLCRCCLILCCVSVDMCVFRITRAESDMLVGWVPVTWPVWGCYIYMHFCFPPVYYVYVHTFKHLFFCCFVLPFLWLEMGTFLSVRGAYVGAGLWRQLFSRFKIQEVELSHKHTGYAVKWKKGEVTVV